MNWQEKYFEISLKAVEKGRSLQQQMNMNTNPTPRIYDTESRRIAHEIADELDRLHDIDVRYQKAVAVQKHDRTEQPF